MKAYHEIRELSPYLHEPPAMASGSPGKRGYLRLGFQRDAQGRTLLLDWERHAPLIVQQALYFDLHLPNMACLYLLSSGGPHVDGDRFEEEITLGRDCEVHLSTGAATLLARMRHNFAALRREIRLEAGAYLEYLPEPMIPARESRYHASLRLVVDPSATLFYSEIFLAGRTAHHDERFAYDLLSSEVILERPSGERLYREKMLITPSSHSPQVRGIMGEWDHFANLLVVAPAPIIEALLRQIKASTGHHEGEIALGVLQLVNRSGLVIRLLGQRSRPLKERIRELCSLLRQEVKGVPLQAEFPWR